MVKSIYINSKFKLGFNNVLIREIRIGNWKWINEM